ncbi:MAG: hypothetical protein D6707_07365 [Bacteroidetes bacterium]|nr:MAG: hypothetical protein D6707_07365 [Bacteroidota bacterium]
MSVIPSYHYLIKYSSEIMTKSPRSRSGLSKQIVKNLSEALKINQIKQITHQPEWAHVYLETDKPADSVILNTPGIHGYHKVKVISSSAPDEIISFAQSMFSPRIQNKTFAVRVRNRLPESRKKEISRRNLEKEIGSLLFPASNGVNLSSPDITCYIEIRKNQTFFYTDKETVKGIGGFPVGASGKSLVLFSGGIDSPVATFLTLKMGIAPRFVYFDLGSKKQLQNVTLTLDKLHKTFFPFQKTYLYILNGTPVLQALQNIPEKFQNLGLKYFFYKISERLAFHNKLHALVTGEAFGQVSTQSFQNLVTLDQITQIPVFRPLLFMQKTEIIQTANRINTFHLSYTGVENCAVAQKHVVINSTPEKLKTALQNINPEKVIQQTLDTIKVYNIKKNEHLSLLSTSKSFSGFDKIIYLSKNENDQLANMENIDFREAWNDFFGWDKTKKYLLVCETGAKSRLLAQFMKENGFQAEGVGKSEYSSVFV